MAEAMGLGTMSTLPNDPTELMKLLILEIRVLQLQMQEGMRVTDSPETLRQQLKTGTEIVVS